jgi:hypothetical protein
MAIDLSKMSIEELLTLRGAVGLELDARGVDYSAIVTVGGKRGRPTQHTEPAYAIPARRVIGKMYAPVLRECGLRLVGCHTERGTSDAYLVVETQRPLVREELAGSLERPGRHPAVVELGRRSRELLILTSNAYLTEYMESVGLHMCDIWRLLLLQSEGITTEEAIRRIKAESDSRDTPDRVEEYVEAEEGMSYQPPLPSQVLERRKRALQDN